MLVTQSIPQAKIFDETNNNKEILKEPNSQYPNQLAKSQNENNVLKGMLHDNQNYNPLILLKRPWRMIKSSIYSLYDYNGEYTDVIKEIKMRLQNSISKYLIHHENSIYFI